MAIDYHIPADSLLEAKDHIAAAHAMATYVARNVEDSPGLSEIAQCIADKIEAAGDVLENDVKRGEV